MTDEQIIRAMAEKIMGWEICGGSGAWYIRQSSRMLYVAEADWSPFTNDADACAVLDKMDADGWAYQVASVKCNGKVICNLVKDGSVGSAEEPNRRRAICIAALKAVEAWEE